jgi:hypothetical protein
VVEQVLIVVVLPEMGVHLHYNIQGQILLVLVAAVAAELQLLVEMVVQVVVDLIMVVEEEPVPVLLGQVVLLILPHLMVGEVMVRATALALVLRLVVVELE